MYRYVFGTFYIKYRYITFCAIIVLLLWPDVTAKFMRLQYRALVHTHTHTYTGQ